MLNAFHRPRFRRQLRYLRFRHRLRYLHHPRFRHRLRYLHHPRFRRHLHYLRFRHRHRLHYHRFLRMHHRLRCRHFHRFRHHRRCHLDHHRCRQNRHGPGWRWQRERLGQCQSPRWPVGLWRRRAGRSAEWQVLRMGWERAPDRPLGRPAGPWPFRPDRPGARGRRHRPGADSGARQSVPKTAPDHAVPSRRWWPGPIARRSAG